jgi:protein-S-isoprenylcysteine O-methyltransferase Ste14
MSRTSATLYAISLPLSLAALVLLPAGRIDWTAGWIFIAVLVAAFGLSALLLAGANPMIYRARSRFQPGTEKWDLILLAVLFPAILIEIPFATLDAGRMGWSDVPLWVILIGYGLLIGGIAVTTWGQAVNPFFEPGVRIQRERAQRVIMSGPYKFVRHPGYTAAIAIFIRSHLPLGGPCCRLLWRSRCLWCGRIGRIACSAPSYPAMPSMRAGRAIGSSQAFGDRPVIQSARRSGGQKAGRATSVCRARRSRGWVRLLRLELNAPAPWHNGPPSERAPVPFRRFIAIAKDLPGWAVGSF